MMLPTHAVVGLALATPLVVLRPDIATVALTGSFIGSILPDLDMYAGHRRTLHYPTGYVLGALPVGAIAVLVPSPAIVGVAAVLVGAAVHCQMDRYGGGLELRPWEGTSERGVYDHVRGQWLPPKRWIRYDGSPGDLLLLVVVALPLLVVLERPFRELVVVALGIGSIYVGLRRRLATLAPVVVGYLPVWLEDYIPERYHP